MRDSTAHGNATRYAAGISLHTDHNKQTTTSKRRKLSIRACSTVGTGNVSISIYPAVVCYGAMVGIFIPST